MARAAVVKALQEKLELAQKNTNALETQVKRLQELIDQRDQNAQEFSATMNAKDSCIRGLTLELERDKAITDALVKVVDLHI